MYDVFTDPADPEECSHGSAASGVRGDPRMMCLECGTFLPGRNEVHSRNMHELDMVERAMRIGALTDEQVSRIMERIIDTPVSEPLNVWPP